MDTSSSQLYVLEARYLAQQKIHIQNAVSLNNIALFNLFQSMKRELELASERLTESVISKLRLLEMKKKLYKLRHNRILELLRMIADGWSMKRENVHMLIFEFQKRRIMLNAFSSEYIQSEDSSVDSLKARIMRRSSSFTSQSVDNPVDSGQPLPDIISSQRQQLSWDLQMVLADVASQKADATSSSFSISGDDDLLIVLLKLQVLHLQIDKVSKVSKLDDDTALVGLKSLSAAFLKLVHSFSANHAIMLLHHILRASCSLLRNVDPDQQSVELDEIVKKVGMKLLRVLLLISSSKDQIYSTLRRTYISLFGEDSATPMNIALVAEAFGGMANEMVQHCLYCAYVLSMFFMSRYNVICLERYHGDVSNDGEAAEENFTPLELLHRFVSVSVSLGRVLIRRHNALVHFDGYIDEVIKYCGGNPFLQNAVFLKECMEEIVVLLHINCAAFSVGVLDDDTISILEESIGLAGVYSRDYSIQTALLQCLICLCSSLLQSIRTADEFRHAEDVPVYGTFGDKRKAQTQIQEQKQRKKQETSSNDSTVYLGSSPFEVDEGGKRQILTQRDRIYSILREFLPNIPVIIARFKGSYTIIHSCLLLFRMIARSAFLGSGAQDVDRALVRLMSPFIEPYTAELDGDTASDVDDRTASDTKDSSTAALLGPEYEEGEAIKAVEEWRKRVLSEHFSHAVRIESTLTFFDTILVFIGNNFITCPEIMEQYLLLIHHISCVSAICADFLTDPALNVRDILHRIEVCHGTSNKYIQGLCQLCDEDIFKASEQM